MALPLLLFSFPALAQTPTHWKGLKIEPERRSSPYNPEDYKHSGLLEKELINKYGGVYSPYTKKTFTSPRQTDIEHIVAKSEAHDSGLSLAPIKQRKIFANDLINLTLASPDINRFQKMGKDAGEWLPPQNKCWFVDKVIQVKKKYKLSIDLNEYKALKKVSKSCNTFQMEKRQTQTIPLKRRKIF